MNNKFKNESVIKNIKYQFYENYFLPIQIIFNIFFISFFIMQQQNQFWIPHNIGKYSFINEVEENKWNAINQESKKEVFVQIVSKKDYPTKDAFYKLTRYIELTKNLQSQFFSQCLDFFEDKRFFYVIFDKPEGITLKEYVSKNCGKITEKFVKTFFTNLISAFQKLENNQFSITYNNIYVSNFDSHDNNNADQLRITIIPYMMKYIVNPNYIFEAPEVFLGKSKNSISNVWTCGVILYFISTGTLPFEITPFNSTEFQKIVLNDQIQIPLYLPSDVKDLLNKMFVKNSYARIKFEQLFEHCWIKEDAKQTSKSYSRLNTEQFPSLWSQPNVINISAKNDEFMKTHHVHVQIHSKKRPNRFQIEKIKKSNIF